ncbi:hypothetical protein D1159_08730 [Pseudoflavonifractor sp. 524-17]|uniref:hypothetical protein n=1 Tax=Pseudoflavonifractor sp. 524-17 TaxID=2304577 RepID=UPI00137AD21F|nr:hypothetical protein [Pseudoflavonifractor sp. 524-17]NCE64668.1 hypothetical protein [Pseudoflavonifractor sp. 524-17]
MKDAKNFVYALLACICGILYLCSLLFPVYSNLLVAGAVELALGLNVYDLVTRYRKEQTKWALILGIVLALLIVIIPIFAIVITLRK